MKTKHKLIYTLITLILGAHASVFAQKGQLNDSLDARTKNSNTHIIALNKVVIQENRLKTPLNNQNRNIRVLDRAQIQALPARNINELLGMVAGVDLRHRGPFGSQADVAIDGGTFEQTLILVNGVKMLDAQTAHHALNLPVPLEAIERIEIIRGSAARVYGINSLTGAINIVTKTPESSELIAHTYAGSSFQRDTAHQNQLFNGRGLSLGGTLVGNKASHSLYGSHESGNGHRYNTAFRNTKLFTNHQIQTGKASSLNLMAGYVSADFGANGFYAAPGDIESQEIVQTFTSTLGYELHISEQFSIRPRVSYRHTDDDYRYFRHDLSRARSRHKGQALAPEINATWTMTYGDLGFGAEMRNETIRSSNIGNHNRNNFGSYMEFKSEYIQNFSVNGGVYLNYNSDYGWQWFPGVDLGWQVAKSWKVTAHAGTGQRIPSFTDLYLDQRPGNIGNPNIRPEEAWHIDGGVKYFGSRMMANAHYFYRNISDFIDWVYPLSETPPYQPVNFDQNKVHGLSAVAELWLSRQTTNQWRASIQYTWLKPSYSLDATSGFQSKYVTEALKQQLIGQFMYRNRGLAVNLAARYQERMSYKDYLLADIRMAYHFEKLESYLDIQNMLDTKYIEAAAAPMPGRWLSLGLKYYWQK